MLPTSTSPCDTDDRPSTRAITPDAPETAGSIHQIFEGPVAAGTDWTATQPIAPAAAPATTRIHAMRRRIDSTIIVAKPATIAPPTSGTGDGASFHVVETEIVTATPSTSRGIVPSWMRSPRWNPGGASGLIQWARWSCQAYAPSWATATHSGTADASPPAAGASP